MKINEIKCLSTERCNDVEKYMECNCYNQTGSFLFFLNIKIR